jgi:hypothetical protein
VSRNFEEKRLRGAVFLNVAKAFDTVWVNGPLHKLAIPNFPSKLVKPISSCMSSWAFESSLQTATSLAVACGLSWLRVE